MNSKTEHNLARILHKKTDGIKVLIVVDKYISGTALKNMFDIWGYNIIGICTSNQEVLDKVKEKKPDLIFTDIELTNCSGIHLVQQLSFKHNDSNLSIYFTAYATDLSS